MLKDHFENALETISRSIGSCRSQLKTFCASGPFGNLEQNRPSPGLTLLARIGAAWLEGARHRRGRLDEHLRYFFERLLSEHGDCRD
jgi:hypothetical protein